MVVVVAAALRGSGIGWDSFTLQHPDERFLAFVAERLSLPRSPAELFDPERAPSNPNRHGFEFFVYGALPPLVEGVLARWLGAPDLEGIVAVGRCLTTLLDVTAVLLLFVLGRRLGGPSAGLLAAAGWATCGFAIQQARFATVDVWGTTAVVAVACTVVGRRLSVGSLLGAGALVGVAASSKPNLATVILIPAAAVAVEAWRCRHDLGRALGRAVLHLALVATAALLALKLLDPGAFASAASPLPSPARLAALRQLREIFAGAGQYPPNLQWADRRLVLEPLTNLLLWGSGPLLGVAVLAGLGRVVRRALGGEGKWVPILAWLAPAAVWQLSRFVCSVRHLHALLALAVLAAAVWLARQPRPWWRLLTLATTALWGTAWASLAWQPHTRVAASQWLVANLPAGAVVTGEYWDDALPLAGHGAERFAVRELRVFDPDTPAKREAMLAALEAADAVVLASQRGVGAIARVGDAYPLTAEFYHLLFRGALGFELAATFERRLGWGPLSVSDRRAEEALSVYDHPPVWIFRKTARWEPQLARALLERVALPARHDWHTRELVARGTPPDLHVAAGGGALPGRFETPPLQQGVSLLLWCAVWEMLAIVGQRLIARVAPTLPDGGWGVARWVGGATAGLGWLWLGWLAVPGWNGVLPTIVAVAAAPWAARAWWRAWRDPRFRVAAAVAWSFFAVFLLIRAGNPEIYWGEKPMDAAILAALWRADQLPPGDPWFAGCHLNYYFFGFLPHALVARATGAGLGVAFNLAAATVPALLAGAAVSVGWLLAGRRLGGVLAALLAQGVGTAAALVRPGLLRAPEFSQFWASSRVIPDTINEYPVWTALFADLHAHFLSFPGFVTAVLVISAVAAGALRGAAAARLVGAVVAVQWMTNAWELPALVLLVGAALVARRPRPWGWRRLVARGRWLARAGAVALMVSAPVWLLLRQPAAVVAWGRGTPLPLGGLAELFGLPFALLAVAAVASWLAEEVPPQGSWGWGLVAAGFGLALAPAVVTVADPMNTVFKLHLQAHLLLAVAAGGLLVGVLPRLPRTARIVAAAVAAVPMVIGLATSTADATAVLRRQWVAGPRPSLDGASYLRVHAPEQAESLRVLAAMPAVGTVVEPLGPPYSDTLRVPMFTGHPAVVGWEVHLWQRRQSWLEITKRQEDLEVLAFGADAGVVAALARRYEVGGACLWGGLRPAVANLPGWGKVGETSQVMLASERVAREP